jgi:hypothetical protein
VLGLTEIITYVRAVLSKKKARRKFLMHFLYVNVFLQSKLGWLKQELREMRDRENRIRGDVKDVILSTEKDRHLLMAEIERQSEALEQLAFHRQSNH